MARSKLLSRLAVGAAVAGAAGYLVGILSAPSKGSKTRKNLKKATNNEVVELEKQLKQLHGELNDLLSQAKGRSNKVTDKADKRFGSALKNANSAKDKLREVISSIHEGETSDSDLGKALEDARRSLSHLKNFIKK